MIEQRVRQLQQRYLSTYGDELGDDEIARYVNGLIIERQRDELRVFDQLSPKELIETIAVLTKPTVEIEDECIEIPLPSQDEPVAAPTKRRGRPKKQ